MKTSSNISKVAKCVQDFLRACFLIFIMLYLSNGFFPDNPYHFDAEAIESSENHQTETEGEKEGNKKETEQDDHLKFFYGYGVSHSVNIQLIEGDLFTGGSSYLDNSTPPPERV